MLHINVTKEHIGNRTGHGTGGPGFDPRTVLRTDESAVDDFNVGHKLPSGFAEAADADAVAGAAGDVADDDVLGAADHGDAVVAGLDEGSGDLDVGGSSDADSVGVGAVAGGG
nr:Os06g0545601 [Ipomoea trifida]